MKIKIASFNILRIFQKRSAVAAVDIVMALNREFHFGERNGF